MRPHQHFAAVNPLTGKERPDEMGGFVRYLRRHDGTVLHVMTTIHYAPDLHPYLPVWHAAAVLVDHGTPMVTGPVRGIVESACIAALAGVGDEERELWAYNATVGRGDLRALTRPDEAVGYGYPVRHDVEAYGYWRLRHRLGPYRTTGIA